MPISNNARPGVSPELVARYAKQAEKNARATANATEQLTARYNATYERATSSGQLKPLDAKRTAQMDSLWQSLGGLSVNISEKRAGAPTRVLTSYDNELFVRTQPTKSGARPTWESAGPLLDATAAKGWVAK